LRSRWERRRRKSPTTTQGDFQAGNIEVPKTWSRLPPNCGSKYFYGDIANGTDPEKAAETSVRQLNASVTRTITIAAWPMVISPTPRLRKLSITADCSAHQYGSFQ